jgi:dipeptidyl aminopeptidase/acylaminoacyl peptidase
VSKSTNWIAANFRNWKTPQELVLLPAKAASEPKTVTNSHPGTFDKFVKTRPQLFNFRNRHGQTVYGQMMLPAGWKKDGKYPLLVYVYGGPLGRGKEVNDGDFDVTKFRFPMYLTHKHQFVTVTVDPRGSSGYGGAFGGANWDNPGVAQTEDLTDLVKYLVENFAVDSKRTAIHGWSFGGWQTQHIMYTAPGVFTLGIAGAGPTQWQNYNNWYTGGVITNTPPGKNEVIDKFSLTKVAKNLKDPLMLLHGMEDDNVLYQDTIFVYRELLKANKGPLVELVLDPTGGHGLGGDIDAQKRFMIYYSFIKRRWNLPD